MNKESGFTFVEMLLTFSVLLVIVSFMSPFLRVIYHQTSSEFNQLEWQVFVQQVKMEIREAKNLSITNQNHTLSFINPRGQKISYEVYQDKIRRRVNGTGNEVILQKITSIIYTPKSNGCMISITTVDGTSLDVVVSSFMTLEVEVL
ncbi:competence type IV pilus minor pilin ComGF [Fredinandcohnia sp. 179-A 10B2 NHS]|uniref:competence type IV pilus minor pilin ComGF n=1 Tax=Fredinandcohnia sp. 179-A 10B2 NHS TaxID=3235176 RepID=UPI0039A10C3D